MHAIRKIAPLLAACVLCASCVGVDSHLSVRPDGSGTLHLDYRVSRLVADLGTSTSDQGSVPLPLSRDDFQQAVAGTQGKVRLTHFDRSQNDKDILVHATLEFASLDALARVNAFRDAQLELTTTGSTHTFSQLVARSPSRPISADSLAMVDSFFGDYSLTFSIQTPSPITSSSLGTLSSDKRTLTYTTTVRDLLSATKDVTMTASW